MESSKNDIYNFDDFEIFPWSENLDTGHKNVDKQHRKLVNLLNRLARALVNNHEVLINQAFDELADYAEYHFREEEAYWKDYFGNDSWYTLHHKSHESFLPQVLEMREKKQDKNDDDVIEEIVNFLIKWLAFHIIDSDKRMAIVVSEIKKGKTLEDAKEYSTSSMSGSLKILTDTILLMYDGLSSNAIRLMKERRARINVERALKKANHELEIQAITDPLTGLYNRREFNLLGEREFKKAIRSQDSLAFVEMDVDHFKKYNDTKGHLEGDRILRKLGKIIKESCRRPGDYPFRLGGEEFGILMVHQNLEGAKLLSERIRIRLEREESVTLSSGVSLMIPGKNQRIEDLVKSADDLLYKAKERGRNMTLTSYDIQIR